MLLPERMPACASYPPRNSTRRVLIPKFALHSLLLPDIREMGAIPTASSI